jgi:hypothetical protein
MERATTAPVVWEPMQPMQPAAVRTGRHKLVVVAQQRLLRLCASQRPGPRCVEEALVAAAAGGRAVASPLHRIPQALRIREAGTQVHVFLVGVWSVCMVASAAKPSCSQRVGTQEH